MTTTQKLEEKEKALLASELEVKIQSRHPKPPYISYNTNLHLAGVLPQQTGPESGGGPGDLRGQAAACHAEARQGIWLCKDEIIGICSCIIFMAVCLMHFAFCCLEMSPTSVQLLKY